MSHIVFYVSKLTLLVKGCREALWISVLFLFFVEAKYGKQRSGPALQKEGRFAFVGRIYTHTPAACVFISLLSYLTLHDISFIFSVLFPCNTLSHVRPETKSVWSYVEERGKFGSQSCYLISKQAQIYYRTHASAVGRKGCRMVLVSTLRGTLLVRRWFCEAGWGNLQHSLSCCI